MKRSAAAAFVLLAAACGEPKYDPPRVAAVLPDPATTGSVRGEAVFEGTPPPPRPEPMGANAECLALHDEKPLMQDLLVKNGRIRNVFVHLKEGLDPRYRFPIPEDEHVIDNVKCRYVPRVSGARVWQKLRLRNSDPIQHNVRSEYWSRTFQTRGQSAVVWVEKPRVMLALRCDLHAWMLGYVGLLEHPFFAVTDEDGAFEIKGLPPGEYTIEAWHETLGTHARRIRIEPRGSAHAVFTFKK